MAVLFRESFGIEGLIDAKGELWLTRVKVRLDEAAAGGEIGGETVQVALPEGDSGAGLDLGGGGQGGGEVQVTILRSTTQGLGDDSLTEQIGLRQIKDGGPQGGLRERLGEEGLGFWQPLCRPGKGTDTGKGAAFTSGGEPEAGLETTGRRQFAVSDGGPLGEPVAVVGIEVGFAEPFLGRCGMLREGGKLALQPRDKLDGLTSGTRTDEGEIESGGRKWTARRGVFERADLVGEGFFSAVGAQEKCGLDLPCIGEMGGVFFLRMTGDPACDGEECGCVLTTGTGRLEVGADGLPGSGGQLGGTLENDPDGLKIASMTGACGETLKSEETHVVIEPVPGGGDHEVGFIEGIKSRLTEPAEQQDVTQAAGVFQHGRVLDRQLTELQLGSTLEPGIDECQAVIRDEHHAHEDGLHGLWRCF